MSDVRHWTAYSKCSIGWGEEDEDHHRRTNRHGCWTDTWNIKCLKKSWRSSDLGSKFGDFQSNPFQIGKIRNPRQVAETVKEAFGDNDAFSEVSVAGPGFWTSSFQRLDCGKVKELTSDVHRGIPQVENKPVVIDFCLLTWQNGCTLDMRSTIIGHTIDQMWSLQVTKWLQTTILAIETQFEKLIVSWREDLNREAFEATQSVVGTIVRAVWSSWNTWKTRTGKARNCKTSTGWWGNLSLWKHFIEVSLKEFDSVYERLGIQFDVVLGESFYDEHLPNVVDSLLEHGVAIDSDGAVIVPFKVETKDAFGNGSCDSRKGWCFSLWYNRSCDVWVSFEDLEPDEIVYVTNMRRNSISNRFLDRGMAGVQAVQRIRFGFSKLTHVWFGMLKLPEGAMSTRAGNVIRLVDLLDEAVQRAKAVVDEVSFVGRGAF